MIKAIWRLALNSITTTAILSLAGMPADEAVAVIGLFGVLLWLQEDIIETVRERMNHDRSIRSVSGGRRKSGRSKKHNRMPA